MAEERAVGPIGDPQVLGLPMFVVGAVALALALTGYVSSGAAGSVLPIVLGATGVGLLITTWWACSLGQTFVATVFGLFAGFWLSYAALLLGLSHGWYVIPADDVLHTVSMFLIAWAIVIFFLMVAALRLPLAYPLLLALVVVALLFVIIGTLNANTTMTKTGGYFVFGACALGVYLFLSTAAVSLGGKAFSAGNPVIKG